ncbi:MlaA family lipoprotein [Sphingomonas bacterium]|uniref:MlaA family lipoprotein n=1 Tax=Sphingomonas bacterium TaxID=1895847 RepID=UPI0020C69B75|nr:VacJ family lipoprotein [Sphingomonas bacterium]
MIAALIGPMLALAAPLQAAPPAVGPPAAPIRTSTPGDPHERFNRRMFARYQRFDRHVLGPTARGYARIVPKPVRGGIRHFFANLGEPLVFLNYLLQLKPGKAAETAGRFVINSTLGLGGLVDVAKLPGVRLPHRPNGFGDTLGYYGVKPGAYLFLPVIGPTTVRDLLGGQADGLVLPLAVGTPFDKLAYQVPHAVLTGLDQRAEAEGDLQALLAGAVDPYATLRSVYLQDRAGEIAQLHGAHRPAGSQDGLADPLIDPAAPPDAGPPELQDPLADPAAVPAPAGAVDPATPAPSPPAADPATPARR